MRYEVWESVGDGRAHMVSSIEGFKEARLCYVVAKLKGKRVQIWRYPTKHSKSYPRLPGTKVV